jgi:hypothetical protein
VQRSLACSAALAVLVGAAWSCASFGADGTPTSTPDASASDASVSDATADGPPLDGAPPDGGGGGEGGPGGDAGPLRGAKCMTASNFCAPTDVCCFQLGGAADACLKKGTLCNKAGGSTGIALLTCTDRESCPGALPFCCLDLAGPTVAAGSTCRAACTGPQLCTANDECTGGTMCVGLGGAYSLDSFQTYCK